MKNISSSAVIAETSMIHDGAVIEDHVVIHDYVVVYPGTVIGEGTEIYDHCVLGKPPTTPGVTSRKLKTEYRPLVIGKNSI